MDETKNPSETEGSPPPVGGSSDFRDDTESLPETEGFARRVENSGEPTNAIP